MDGGHGALGYDSAPADKFSYQEKGIEEIREIFQQKFRGVTYVAPTGSGKSFVTAKLARMLLALGKGKQFRYLAPRKLLVSGVSEKLTDLGIEHAVRMSGVPWDGGRMPDVQAWCIQSFFNHLKKCRNDSDRLGTEFAPQHVDLFVIDEAHTHQPAIRKLWQMFPRSRFIYLTATPLPGMDRFSDSLVNGPAVNALQALGILVPVRYKTYESDGTEAEALRGEIVQTWIAQGEDRKTVVFCKNRREAKYIQEKFVFHGIPAEYMDANTPRQERDAIRERIRSGESKLVINVEVMGYGVDWPFIECIVLAYVVEAKLQDTATRLAEYIQKVGRGIRACEGKTDLVVIDHTGTYLLFGPVEQEIEWTIDSEGIREKADNVKQRQEAERQEPELITCRECGFQFIQLSECPRCRAVVHHQISDDVRHVEAQIEEVDTKTNRHKRKPAPAQALWTRETSHKAFMDILWCVRNKKKKDGSSYSDGMAFHIYEKLHTGIPAPFIKYANPIEPDAKMKEWGMNAIRSHNASFFIRSRYKRRVA